MRSFGFMVGVAVMIHLVPKLKMRHAFIGPGLIMGGIGVIVKLDGDDGLLWMVGAAAGRFALGAALGAGFGYIGWLMASPLFYVRNRIRRAAPIAVAYARPADDDPDRGAT